VKELVTPTNWVCLATKSDNGLSAKVEIYQGNMKATTGERPHFKIIAAAKANDVQIYVASQRSGGSKQSTAKAEDITERMCRNIYSHFSKPWWRKGPIARIDEATDKEIRVSLSVFAKSPFRPNLATTACSG
jgi:L-2-hydroxyglutarate oxidase LhgO